MTFRQLRDLIRFYFFVHNMEKRLEHRNIRPTAMRIIVLRQLVESGTAVSLKDLESKIERADRATLFRTLKTFEENKLIHSIDAGTGSVKYALCEEACLCNTKDQHVHFHCTKCDETFCLTQSKIPEIHIPKGFQVDSGNMVYKGICPNCK